LSNCTSFPVTSKIQPITASVASNALTITLSPTVLDFRSATIGSGAIATVSNASSISVVVPSTATLGAVSAVQSRLVVLAINNAGTMELAVTNISGGSALDETGIISTTLIAAASNSATLYYSTTARTSVAYRVVGYVESTQATAGTWATAPSTIQGEGGLVVPGSLVRSGTAVASTSGTSIDFTGIPSWAKRITVMFSSVSTNGTSLIQARLGSGSGGIESTSYLGNFHNLGTASFSSSSLSSGIQLFNNAASSLINGMFSICLLNQVTNTWAFTGSMAEASTSGGGSFEGTKSLASTLDRVRITTVNGTDTFDAGSINILWE
jgi:hypothetical protein